MRSRLTYANVMSTIAVFVALSGGAFAATYVITSTKQIKPSVLKKLKGKRGKIGPTGPAGVAGAKGDKGDTGTVDTSNFFTKTESDGRFLAAGGTAVNSALLESTPKRGLISNFVGLGAANTASTASGGTTFVTRDLPENSGIVDVMSFPGLGKLTVQCGDNGANFAVTWGNESTTNHNIVVDVASHNLANLVVLNYTLGSTASQNISNGAPTAITVLDGIVSQGDSTTTVGPPGVVSFRLSVVPAPGAAELCRVSGQATSQTR